MKNDEGRGMRLVGKVGMPVERHVVHVGLPILDVGDDVDVGMVAMGILL
jgi:hypothetical protein